MCRGRCCVVVVYAREQEVGLEFHDVLELIEVRGNKLLTGAIAWK